LDWLGHVIRVTQTKAVKKILENKPEEENWEDPY
jgi:hypothetical protein